MSKQTVRSVQLQIQAIVEDFSTSLSAYASTGEIVDLGLLYLAWSTDSVSAYLEDRPLGLLRDDKMAKDWFQTVKTTAEFTPLIKQFPIIM